MERRRAVAVATATVATTLGAVAAVAANFGLLGLGTASPTPMGQLDAGRAAEVSTPAADPAMSATAAAPNVTVRYEDIYLPAPAAPAAVSSSATAPVVGAPTDESGRTTVAGEFREDDDDPDRGDDDYDRGDDDHDRGDDDHERSADEEREEWADD